MHADISAAECPEILDSVSTGTSRVQSSAPSKSSPELNDSGVKHGSFEILRQDLKGMCDLSLLLQVGLPSCTWPFCLATLLFLLLTTKNPNIYKMPLSKVTYPEENRIFYLQAKKRLVESPLWMQPPSTAMVTSHFWLTTPVDFEGLKTVVFTTNKFHTKPSVISSFSHFVFFFQTPKHAQTSDKTHQGDVLWLWNLNPSGALALRLYCIYKVRMVHQKEEGRPKLIIDIYWYSWCLVAHDVNSIKKLISINQLSLKWMEFRVTKSKSTQNSQISHLAYLKSMQVTHYSSGQHCRAHHWALSPAPQQNCLHAIPCVWHSLTGDGRFVSGWQSCRRENGIPSFKIILYCHFSWILQRIF